MKNFISFFVGFIVLFLFYHVPEFFQQYYHQPLVWLLESGMLVCIVVSYVIIKIQKQKSLAGYGLFELGKYKFNLMKGLLLGFAFAALANMLTVWLQWNELSHASPLSQTIIQTLIFAAGTLLPSLAEDILTRGYLFAHWPQQWNKQLFVIVSALVFALNHIFRLTKPDIMVYIFILGLLLAWCLIYTRSLWLTMGLHWGSNIAYQFFANVVTLKTIKETGYDNYLLAACYFVGWLIVIVLYKLSFFKAADI